MKRILFMMVVLLQLFVSAAAQTDVTLNGVTIDTKQSAFVPIGGILQFESKAPLQFQQVFSDENYGFINDRTVVVYAADHLYVYKYKQSDYDMQYVRFYVYKYVDGTWTHDVSDMAELPAAFDSFPHAMTYNPQNGVLYGYRNAMNGTIFTIDPNTGVMKSTVNLPSGTYLNSLTTDAYGVTYATDYDGNLYTINLTNGSLTALGNTGIRSGDVLQGAIDAASGRFFLYVPNGNNGVPSLYEVDTHNASSTHIADFDNSVCGQMRAIFSTSSVDKGNGQAPDICSDLYFLPKEPGSLDVTFHLTAPALAFDKETALRDNVNIQIYVDEATEPAVTASNVAPGSEVMLDYTFATSGLHSFKAVASNETGDGAPLTVEQWAGFDVPTPPTDVVFTLDEEGNYTATWKAPTVGLHDGDINQTALSYRATLYPDKQLAEAAAGTTLSGKVSGGAYKDYYIGVSATTPEGTSEEAFSNRISYGKSFDVPYVEDFSKEETWGIHTIVDDNGSPTWEYSKSMAGLPAAVYNGNNSDRAASDWLITPPFNLHAGATYTITFTVNSAFNQDTGNHIGVYQGYDPNCPEEFTCLGSFTNIPDFVYGLTTYTTTFKCSQEGMGYFAFYCYSEANRKLFLTNYSIVSTASPKAPADVTGLHVTAGEKGELTATIEFTTPMLTTDGESLDGLTAVKIFRDGSLVPIHEIESPEMGAKITYTYNESVTGKHRYSVRAFNEFGNSNGVTVEAYVGEGIPLPPKNLRLTQDDDYFLLNWDAPEGGEGGLYVDNTTLSYTVYYQYGMMETPAVFESGLQEHSLRVPKDIFDEIAPYLQFNLTFFVQAVSTAGGGVPAWTEINYGKAYSLPFEESFYNSYTDTTPWGVVGLPDSEVPFIPAWSMLYDYSDRRPVSYTSYDNDGGMALFFQREYSSYTARLLTPAISAAEAEEPILSFYMYHTEGASSANSLQIELKTECPVEGEDVFTEVGEPISVGGASGWQYHEIPLKDAMSDRFRIVFRGTALNGVSFSIDKVRVYADPLSGIENNLLKNTVPVFNGRTLTGCQPYTGYQVFNAAGQRIATGQTDAFGQAILSNSVEPGAYIVRIGGQSIKCMVK